MSPIVSGGGSGSSQPSTATTTITANRAAGFEVDHVFDLGQIASFYIASTITASDPDGLTWGTGSGEVAVDVEGYQVSNDGVSFISIATSFWYQDVIGTPGTALFAMAFVTAHYVKVNNFRVYDNDTFNTYAGVASPTVTGRFDVSYR